MRLEDYDEVMNTNVRAALHLTQLCLPHLIKTKGTLCKSVRIKILMHWQFLSILSLYLKNIYLLSTLLSYYILMSYEYLLFPSLSRFCHQHLQSTGSTTSKLNTNLFIFFYIHSDNVEEKDLKRGQGMIIFIWYAVHCISLSSISLCMYPKDYGYWCPEIVKVAYFAKLYWKAEAWTSAHLCKFLLIGYECQRNNKHMNCSKTVVRTHDCDITILARCTAPAAHYIYRIAMRIEYSKLISIFSYQWHYHTARAKQRWTRWQRRWQ